MLIFSFFVNATTVDITTNGQNFSPQITNISLGDSIHFILDLSHNAVEVSLSTYNSLGTTSNGGFDLPFGSDTTIFLAAGVYYYVCQPHVGNGMIGQIFVSAGCSDISACNYDSLALVDDGSCYYLTASYTQSDYNGFGVSCNGDSDGFIDLTVTGGVGLHTYVWSNGSTSEDIALLSAGTYSLVASDESGCITTETVVITESVTLTSSYTQSDYNGFGVSCNGDSDGSIDLSVNGGVDNQNYSYTWSNGDTNEDLVGIGFGTYDVIVTDANSCSTSETVIVTEGDILTSSFTTSDWNNFEIQCNGGNNGEITLAILGGVTGQSYSYAIDGLSNPTNIFSNLTAGTYVVTALDANGCITSDTVTMTEPATEIISSYTQSDYNGFGVSCNGDSDGFIDLTVTGGVGLHTYVWSNGSTSEDIALLSAGTYSLVASDESGCITTETVVITESVTLTSSYTQSDYNGFGVSCNGDSDGSIDLSVNGGVDNQNYSYTWSNGDTNEDLVGIGFGTYDVIVTDANSCSTSETVIVTEPDVFVGGQLSVSQTICNDGGGVDSIITILSPVGGNPPYTFDWEVNNGSGFVSLSNNNNHWFLPPVTLDTIIYKIIYSDDYQCNTFSDFSTIIVNPLPVSYPIIGDMIVCSNQSDASYTLSTTPQNYRYEWYTIDGNIVGTNESRNCIIDWPILPGSLVNLDVVVSIVESGCEISETSIIEISQIESPYRNMIEQMTNTNILVCNDTSNGIQYQWGYTVINDDLNVVDSSHVDRFNQFSNTIDTLVNRYWVITSFVYGNDSCSTISYYNPPPDPLEILDVSNNLTFFPNPVDNILNWNGINLNSIKLIDSMGRNIKCDIDYLNQNIDVSNIKPGIYFLNISLGKKEFINKIIVK